MIKGVLVGLGIILVCALIPIVHFIAVPASPFLAGYFGISFAKDNTDSYGVKGMKFGALLSLLILSVTGIAAAAVMSLLDPTQKIVVVMWIGIAIFTLYTGSMAALGAMYSTLRADRGKPEPALAD